jgi:hypothetical protein
MQGSLHAAKQQCDAHAAAVAAEDYTYALERDKQKPPRTHRSSRSNKLLSLREGLLSKTAASTGDGAAAAAASGLNSLTLSTATSSDIGSMLNAHDEGRDVLFTVVLSNQTAGLAEQLRTPPRAQHDCCVCCSSMTCAAIPGVLPQQQALTHASLG